MKNSGSLHDLPAPTTLWTKTKVLIDKLDALHHRADGATRSEVLELLAPEDVHAHGERHIRPDAVYRLQKRTCMVQVARRQLYMTRRWAETKYAQRLVAGGHVANLAKYLAARITDVLERNSSEVDAPGVTMFFSQSDPAQSTFEFSKLVAWTW